MIDSWDTNKRFCTKSANFKAYDLEIGHFALAHATTIKQSQSAKSDAMWRRPNNVPESAQSFWTGWQVQLNGADNLDWRDISLPKIDFLQDSDTDSASVVYIPSIAEVVESEKFAEYEKLEVKEAPARKYIEEWWMNVTKWKHW